MANNVIMFYSDFNGRNLQNLSADLCVYSNAIVNCTVSLTSTLDYTTFAPYDSVECVLLNHSNVHSNTEYEYNYYSFMRVGTNPALTNMGADSTSTTAIAAGPIFYISEVSDMGGGMRKIKGVSALALLETEHYPGGYWTTSNRGNAVNEAINLMRNWHQQTPSSNSIYSEGLVTANANVMLGLLGANTNRNVLGQLFIAYGWHAAYDRNTINNATIWISRNPSNFCTYAVPLNRIYIGNNRSDQAQSAGYRVNVTGYDYSVTEGCSDAIVLNNSSGSASSDSFEFTCTPVQEATLEALIGIAYVHQNHYVGGGDHDYAYNSVVRKMNLWVKVQGVLRINYDTFNAKDFLVDPKKVSRGSTVNFNSDRIPEYNMAQYFSQVTPCEITIRNLTNYPFPWDACFEDNGWTVGIVLDYSGFATQMCISSNAGGNISSQLILRANTLNVCATYLEGTSGTGLTTTDYNISDIGIITTNASAQNMQNVLARVSNFAAARTTEKLSFPWNGARPGDILNIDNNRNGFITDMTITLSNIPKATANVRIGYNGR